MGSREEVEVNGKKVRARKYPWGTVEGEIVFNLYLCTCSMQYCMYCSPVMGDCSIVHIQFEVSVLVFIVFDS